MPPHGKSTDEDFDPTVHYEIEPDKNPDEEENDDEHFDDNQSFDSSGNPKLKVEKVFRLVVPNLY